MKPERQIRATYADILNSADPATVRVIGDLDALYTGASIPPTPPFNTLLATRARTASQPAGDGPETAIGSATGAPPRNPRNWLRQGFAFAGAAVAFAIVAAVLVVLFRSGDEASRPGAQPTSVPANATATTDEILYIGKAEDGRDAIYAIGADDSGTRLIVSGKDIQSAVWSPDAQRVAFASHNFGVFVIGVNGDGLELIAESGQGIGDRDLAWSPDGTRLAFRRYDPTTNRQNLYIVNADGSNLRLLVDSGDAGLTVMPSWSPDGRQIAFIWRNGGADAEYFVYIVDTTGGEPRQIGGPVATASPPDWSHDGTHLLITQVINERAEVAIADLDGNLTMLASSPSNDGFPRWSPDGRQIAFTSDRDRSNALYVMNADGSSARRLTNIDGHGAFDWSPDGQAIAYATFPDDGGPGSLHVINIDGSGTRLAAEGLIFGTQPDWARGRNSENSAPDSAPPTATTDTRDPSEPVTPNTLDNLAPLQPGQERHFVFDISADFRMDESNFLNWNVKGSERMLPDGTLQQYMIVRDADNNVQIEYVNDGERWWWNQRGWIKAGTAAEGIAVLPMELRLAMLEPHAAHLARTTDAYEVIDTRNEGDAHITRFLLDDIQRNDQVHDLDFEFEQTFDTEIEIAYYEVHTTITTGLVIRTRTVFVTPARDGLSEYALADITFESVLLIDGAENGPGNYSVPEAPSADVLQYAPPAALPGGLTMERHWRESLDKESMILRGDGGPSIDVTIYPSHGGYDPRAMRDSAEQMGGLVVATGYLAGGNIAWMSSEADGWPISAV